MDLSSYGSDSWRRYTLKGTSWWIGQEWGVSLACGTVGRRKLRIIPFHNCYIYWTCLSKKGGRVFMVMIWGYQAERELGGTFLMDFCSNTSRKALKNHTDIVSNLTINRAVTLHLDILQQRGKGLILKVRKSWGLIPTFVEVTGEKLVGGPFCLPLLS